MTETAEVVIIGGGVMGVSTAYHLAARGCTKVSLLEKQSLLGTGATGTCAGGIRHQFSQAVNVELSRLSIQMFRRFSEEIGQELALNLCGYYFLLDNDPDLEQFRANISLQRVLGVSSFFLDPHQLAQALPQVNLQGIRGGTYCPDDGLADPGDVVQGYARRARQLGVRLFTDTAATRIEVESGRVRGVQTTRGRISTSTVVIAAGPWSGRVAQSSGLTLPVRPIRRQLAITTPIRAVRKDFPFIIDFSQALYFHYEGGGILTGMSNPDEPPGFDVSIDEEWRLKHFESAIHRMPLLADAEILKEWAGLYEVTPDNQPILGRLPQASGLLACTGFSGHGFMHGPICGLLMAEEILDGQAHTVDIEGLRFDRFEGRTKTGEYNVV